MHSWPGGVGRREFVVRHSKEGRLSLILECAELRVIVSIPTCGRRLL